MSESRHGGYLKQKLREHRQTLLEGLAQGVSQENYWITIGKIAGLADAEALSADADTELSRGP